MAQMKDEELVAIPGQWTAGVAASPTLAPLHDQAGLTRDGARPVPDLIGSGFLDAYPLAQAAGLRLSVSVWETRVGPWGRVLDQRPLPTGHLRRGGRIAVTVSCRPHEQVPDVQALPLADAIDRLVWLGFVPLVESRRSSCSVSVGHVLATRPVAGALLACGSVVALTVASAQRERTTRMMLDPSGHR
jgi:beta-lactam-binding protein with PASTA domain